MPEYKFSPGIVKNLYSTAYMLPRRDATGPKICKVRTSQQNSWDEAVEITVEVAADGSIVSSDGSLRLVPVGEVLYLSASYDQTNRLWVAWCTVESTFLYWYDPELQDFTTDEFPVSPKVFLFSTSYLAEHTATRSNDILLVLQEDRNIVYYSQQERFKDAWFVAEMKDTDTFSSAGMGTSYRALIQLEEDVDFKPVDDRTDLYLVTVNDRTVVYDDQYYVIEEFE